MSAPTTELRGLALLDAAIAQIEAHPETWNQQAYRCETGMCVAGWAADIAGGRWLREVAEDDHNDDALLAEPDDGFRYQADGVDVTDADSRARRLIGLTEQQADALFDADNNLDDIRRIRDEIAAAVTA